MGEGGGGGAVLCTAGFLREILHYRKKQFLMFTIDILVLTLAFYTGQYPCIIYYIY